MKYKTHYDAIPAHLLTDTVLDVGCGDGSNQRMSKNSYFLQNSTGIDIDTNLFNYEPDRQFDTVLAIHVIEHIPIEKWYMMFQRLTSWVTPHGHLVIGVPYMQSPEVYKHFTGPENMRHVVFGIDEAKIGQYFGVLDTMTFKRYTGPYSQSLMVIWRKKE